LPWTESVLTGAILSPTDPVLVSAIVGREDIPQDLRHLLNIESGLNDGLALPVVIVTLRMIAGQKLSIGGLLLELALGVAVGIAVPSLVIALERLPFFAVTDSFKPLMAAGIGILVYSMCSVVDANAFLGAFFAGITVASLGGDLSSASHELGESVSEIVKLAALLVFGALLSLRFLGDISLGGFGFAVAALLLVRPLALLIALIGNSLPRHQFWAAAWFGPKGFASVTYALLALRSGIERSDAVFHLAALVTAASIIAHSSTDVPVARWIVRHEAK
jgi:NhaP-type Na+/H+ or K+/H+ antiporter